MTRFDRIWTETLRFLVLFAAWIEVFARELVCAVGLGLISAGLALVYVPAALIVPGVILTWLAIPPAPQVRKP